jgi:hypothetical protein
VPCYQQSAKKSRRALLPQYDAKELYYCNADGFNKQEKSPTITIPAILKSLTTTKSPPEDSLMLQKSPANAKELCYYNRALLPQKEPC